MAINQYSILEVPVQRKTLNRAMLAISIIFLVALFSGCDPLGGNPPGGDHPGNDPITLQDSVADDPTYDTLENDFLVAINADRTGNSIAAFASRDTSLDALARRYAKAGAVDTVPANLKSRVATALGTCSEAAFFIGGSTTLSNYVSTLMGGWLAGAGGADTMRDSIFTKIGIGMVVGTNIATPPGGTWHSVVVLLAKP
jgi:hypothetical protein